MKGQKARSRDMSPGFEGGQLPIHRRVPKRGFINIHRVDYHGLNVEDLQGKFDANTEITLELLRERGLVPKKATHVKLLGNGEITTALKVKLHKASKSAVAKVEGAGGSVELVSSYAAQAAQAAEA